MTNKEIFARNLMTYLNLYGISQVELSERIGYSTSTISDWLSAKKYPRIDAIQLLADFFHIKKTDLIENHSFNEENNKIKLLGSVPCGVPIEAIDDIQGFIELDYKRYNSKNIFALEAKGNSMYPMILDEDILIVKHQNQVEQGDIAIIKINGDEATCKKISFNEYGITLIPLNPDFSPMFYSKHDVESLPVQIIGKVIEIRRKI